MAYQKQNFKNGNKLTAEQLNHLEDGLAAASEQVDAIEQARANGEFNGKDGKDGTDGKNGQDGTNGKDGNDGVSPDVSVEPITGGYRITITDARGSNTFDVMDGTPGYTPKKDVDYFDGKDGKDGMSATHSWNGTILTVTSASGSSSADLKGDTGATGAAGKTPVKGVDYFTEADQEAIVQQVIAALGTPVFGRVDAENNIILTGNLVDGNYTLKYEDAEGNVTEIGTINIGFTNMIPLSVDTDGSPYNGGQGWKADTRLTSSGVESAATGTEVTGFMPFKAGDHLRFENIKITGTDEANTTQYIVFYDSGKTKLKHIYTHQLYRNQSQQPYFTLDEDGYWKEYRTENIKALDSAVDWDSVAFIRISAEEITDASIITINQPIG